MTWALKILEIFTLTGSFCAKYITFDLKKYGGVIFHDTEKWCKIWRKANLWFGTWHQEYDKFSLGHLKNWLWWDPSIQSEKCVSLKFTKELRVMTMKNDAKFEETFAKLTFRFKLTWGVPRILTQALKSPKNLGFN